MRRTPGGSLIPEMSFAQVKLNSGNVLPARMVKRIGALGHHVALWAEALETLRGRLEKDRLPEGWRDHVRAGLPDRGATLEQLEVMVRVPEAEAGGWLVEPQRADAVAALGAGPRALLHLPVLRKTWTGWLRESVFEDLRVRLGRAWVVDPTPLPSHGALPGLGIARWGDFDRLAGTGRVFRISPRRADVWTVDSDSTLSDWKVVADELADCPLGGAVIEQLPAKGGSHWRAAFGKTAGVWEMTELVQA
jgi:hypothetical protein